MTNERRSSERSLIRGIAFVVLLTLVVRGGGALAKIDAYSADPDAYRAIATTLAQSGTFGLTSPDGRASPTAFRPPLYPWLLSWFVREGQLANLSVAGLHIGLAAVTAVCTFLAGRSLLGARTGQIAAGLVVCDPILIQQSTLVMTETLAVALTSVVVYAWTQWDSRAQNKPQTAGQTDQRHKTATRLATIVPAVAVPVTLALAFLCRPTFLVWAVLLVIACLIPRRPKADRIADSTRAENADGEIHCQPGRRVRMAIAIFAAMLTAVGLWTIRNQRRLAAPIWATSHGGYTLLLANNPSFYDYLRNGEFGQPWDAGSFLTAYAHRYDSDPDTAEFWQQKWSAETTAATDFSEASDDKLCRDAALAVIRRQPDMFVWACCVRVGRLWSPMPHLTPGRSALTVTAVTAYYITFYLLLAIGTWKLGKRVCGFSYWPTLTLALALTAVHSVYWTNLRMRAPVIPGLALIVAAAFVTDRRVTSENDTC